MNGNTDYNFKVLKTYVTFKHKKIPNPIKIMTKDLCNGGFWLIKQKGEEHPFITCNPVYLDEYSHLFLSCEFIKAPTTTKPKKGSKI